MTESTALAPVNKDEPKADEIAEQIRHGQDVLKALVRRRNHLEVRLAQLGINTPPEISVELDEVAKQIKDVESRIEKLQKESQNPGSQKPIDINVGSDPNNMFIPHWSVLRSRIQYVDANIALRFADAAQDLGILIGFMTLFLGSGISFAVSWLTAEKSEQIMLFGTATAFSVLLTVIFGFLSARAWMRAEKTKQQILESGDSKQPTSISQK